MPVAASPQVSETRRAAGVGGTRRTIPDEIAAALREAILAGEYLPGDALPPERTLASDLGTNRNTLREAVRRLEEAGLVRPRQGQGVRVLDWRRDGRLELLPAVLLADGVAMGERAEVLGDGLRLRTLFIGEAAALAAARRTEEDLAELRALVAPRDPATNDDDEAGGFAALIARDLAFYRALIRSAHSQVGVWAFNTFAPAFERLLGLEPKLWVTPPRYRESLESVIDAVQGRQAEQARDAVASHLRTTDAAVVTALAAAAGEPR